MYLCCDVLLVVDYNERTLEPYEKPNQISYSELKQTTIAKKKHFLILHIEFLNPTTYECISGLNELIDGFEIRHLKKDWLKNYSEWRRTVFITRMNKKDLSGVQFLELLDG